MLNRFDFILEFIKFIQLKLFSFVGIKRAIVFLFLGLFLALVDSVVIDSLSALGDQGLVLLSQELGLSPRSCELH